MKLTFPEIQYVLFNMCETEQNRVSTTRHIVE